MFQGCTLKTTMEPEYCLGQEDLQSAVLQEFAPFFGDPTAEQCVHKY